MATEIDRASLQNLDQVRRMLELEARQGYHDSSAANGTADFVLERLSKALPQFDSEGQRVLREVESLVADYSRLSVENRARCADEALRLLRGLLSTARLNVGAQERAAPPPKPRRKSKSKSKPRSKSRNRVTSLDDQVTRLGGVGSKRAEQLAQLGVETISDLIYLFPRRYVDYSKLDPIVSLLFGQVSTVQGTVTSIEGRSTRTRKRLVDVVVSDESGSIHALFFNPYIERQLKVGARVSISGRVDQYRGTLAFKSPEWEELTHEAVHTGRIVPIYPLTKGLYQKTLRGLVRRALDAGLPLIEDYLPPETFERVQNPPLIPLAQALEWFHYPAGETTDDARRAWALAKTRLAFDEFLGLQVGLLQRKQEWQSEPGTAFDVDRDDLGAFVDSLPFNLTRAQQRALDEILSDMAAQSPMTRLLQGDVGSGKTAVAAAAMHVAVRNGYQAAFMAPTELLAEQHYGSLSSLFGALPKEQRARVCLITGSATAVERRYLYRAIESGYFNIIVGTHALIQEGVSFERLGFAVIDEQHRFGVEQRGQLRSKGRDPDILVMTATPIPRSLALTLHGDLDVSTLDELPPGRQPIETRWLQGKQRNEAYSFVREQVQAGYQAFIVFPLVEESESIEARAAVAEYERLQSDIFPDLRLGLLHGRMKAAEKDEVMLAFRDRELDVLVSTSVVEVGIDIPNATVMIIENADRFGLSQLHQFRGRVGRGEARSYCLLLTDKASQEGRRRLAAMVDTQDGFELAQIDLKMRGPGDFLGTRQSGIPELQFANFADVRDLERARREAAMIVEADPGLERPEHQALRERVERFWTRPIAEVS